MKVVKLPGGWYVEPQTNDEESHLNFLLERLSGEPYAGMPEVGGSTPSPKSGGGSGVVDRIIDNAQRGAVSKADVQVTLEDFKDKIVVWLDGKQIKAVRTLDLFPQLKGRLG